MMYMYIIYVYISVVIYLFIFLFFYSFIYLFTYFHIYLLFILYYSASSTVSPRSKSQSFCWSIILPVSNHCVSISFISNETTWIVDWPRWTYYIFILAYFQFFIVSSAAADGPILSSQLVCNFFVEFMLYCVILFK